MKCSSPSLFFFFFETISPQKNKNMFLNKVLFTTYDPPEETV